MATGPSGLPKRDSNVGIVAAGYADGFPRHIAPDTQVLVRDTHVPIIGTVSSMDMLAVDLTDVNSPARGDEVVLWGERNPIEHVAERAGTIGYEPLLSRLETGLQGRCCLMVGIC